MFTDLIKIEHPPEAEAGQLVTIQVYIKNQSSVAIYIAPSAAVNGIIPVVFSVTSCVAQPGRTYYFTGTFTMPNENAVITAWSGYWGTDDAWHWEDYQTRTTVLAGGVSPDLETLEVDITPVGAGYVTTDPASEEGRSVWYAGSIGSFPEGTTVQVTAHPSEGYEFDHWSDEIEGGVSYENPAMVKPMTERRAVKAHFRDVTVCDQTLEIDITPTGAGHVTTSPASQEGKTTWNHDETGTFPFGTDVQVTAVPDTGYVFDHWSDEIMGGTSTNNPEYVQPMTERRTVKAHFREEAVNGEATITNLQILALGLTEDPTSLGGVTAGPGDIIYVKYSFDYIAHQEANVEVWSSLVIDPFRDYTVKHIVTLPVAGVATEFVQIVGIIIPEEQSTLSDKTYNLWIELRPGPTAKLEGAVTLTGMPRGEFGQIGELILMMVMVMMMSMIMQFMEKPGETTIKIVEAVKAVRTKGASLLK